MCEKHSVIQCWLAVAVLHQLRAVNSHVDRQYVTSGLVYCLVVLEAAVLLGLADNSRVVFVFDGFKLNLWYMLYTSIIT